MENTTATPITVAGLGSMGTALAHAFLNHGHPTTVWNRTAGKAGQLVAAGAREAETLAKGVVASPVVVICVRDYQAAWELLEPVTNHLEGRLLINLTNGAPAQARELSMWANEQGAQYLDGGIMAIPPIIGTEDALVLYSGSRQAFRDYELSLRSLGKSTFVGDDPGLASLNDIALLSAMYGLFAGAVHALALTGSENLSAKEFTDELLMPWLQAMIPSLSDIAEEADRGTEGQPASSSLEMQAAAFDNILRSSEDQGVSSELMKPIARLLNRAVAEGRGDRDVGALVELLKRSGPRQAHEDFGHGTLAQISSIVGPSCTAL